MSKENYIYGRNSIIQALESNLADKVIILEGTHGSSINTISKLAKSANIPITKYDKNAYSKLENEVCDGRNISQGVIARTKQVETIDIKEVVKKAYNDNKQPILVALDEITDPQNFGAIARSAECAGAGGIIIPERNMAPINAFSIKASAGALTKLPISRVTNLGQALENLKEDGFWIVGTDIDAEQEYTANIYNSPIVLVIGSEGKGIRYRTRKICDHLVKINMKGSTQSLNASVSAGILLFEILRQRSS